MVYRHSYGLIAVSLIVLAACAGGGGDASGSYDSPLDDYLGPDAVSFEAGGMSFSYGGVEVTEEYVPTEEDLQKQRELENLVQQCMQDEGFEYVPYVVDPSAWDDPFADAHALPPDEFAEQYGYGISTMHMADSDLPADPNEEIRRGLSPQALAEYERALYGDMEGQELGEGEEWTPPPVEDRGCYDKASAQVWGDPYEDEGSFRDPQQEFERLMEDLWSIQERFMADPRLEEPTEKWRDCIAEAGHPFEEIGEPEQEIWRRMNELQGWDEHMDLEEEAAEGGSPTPEPFVPKEIEPADLDALQEYELAVASADFRCKEEHYNEIAEQVQYEVEEQFVEEHRAELERYRDWMAENEQPTTN